jgi:hypothetical protein
MSVGIPEVHQNPVTHVLRYEAAEAAHDFGDAFLIGRDNLAQVFRVHAGGKRRGANQVREHHRNLTALSGVDHLRPNWRRGWNSCGGCRLLGAFEIGNRVQ